MPSGEKPDLILTGIQNSAQAILRGEVTVLNDVTSDTKCVRSGANGANIHGIAHEDSPGQNKTFPVVKSGIVKCKAGGTITQGQRLESDATGRVVTAATPAATQTRWIVGVAQESAVAGDLVPVDLICAPVTYP